MWSSAWSMVHRLLKVSDCREVCACPWPGWTPAAKLRSAHKSDSLKPQRIGLCRLGQIARATGRPRCKQAHSYVLNVRSGLVCAQQAGVCCQHRKSQPEGGCCSLLMAVSGSTADS